MATWIFETGETITEMVERIARAQYEEPCPHSEREFCSPDNHNWATAHPEDKLWAMARVRFVLKELGFCDAQDGAVMIHRWSVTLG